MKTTKSAVIISILWQAVAATVSAQLMPQDYWYFNSNGLQIPGTFGSICVGPDGNIYAATNSSAIAVFTTNGAFIQQFGTGLNVAGIAADSQTNIYVLNLNSPNGFVNKFSASGALLQQFGAQGAGSNQLQAASGLSEIAVGKDGNVYVVDQGNGRVQVYDSNGNYLLSWPNVAGDLNSILGIAALPDGNFCLIQAQGSYEQSLPVFTSGGLLVAGGNDSYSDNPSICASPDGVIIMINTYWALNIDDPYSGGSTFLAFDDPSYYWGSINEPMLGTGAAAFGLDSTMYVIGITSATVGSLPAGTPLIFGLNRVYGPNQPLNPVPAPLPYITSVQQRTNSSLIDIDYTVQDSAASQVTTAIVAFLNGSEDFNDLVHMTLFAGNTGTNLGPNISANVSHRVTWDASEGTASFANFQFDVLASDNRKMLNIHFITVPAMQGQPAVTMSSSGVEDESLFNMWLWLIATNNASIMLTNGAVVGVGGAYNQQTLASGISTTAAGRQFLYPLFNVRAPTTAELAQAQSGNFGFVSFDGNNVVQLP